MILSAGEEKGCKDNTMFLPLLSVAMLQTTQRLNGFKEQQSLISLPCLQSRLGCVGTLPSAPLVVVGRGQRPGLENLGPTCARCLENLGPFVCWLLGEPLPHVCSLPAGRAEGTLGCGLGFLSMGCFAFLVTRKLGSIRKHPGRQEVESSSALNSGSQSHFPLYSARQSQESDSRGRDVDLTSWQHWQRIWG